MLSTETPEEATESVAGPSAGLPPNSNNQSTEKCSENVSVNVRGYKDRDKGSLPGWREKIELDRLKSLEALDVKHQPTPENKIWGPARNKSDVRLKITGSNSREGCLPTTVSNTMAEVEILGLDAKTGENVKVTFPTSLDTLTSPIPRISSV
ncbi:hypothetical protein ACJJTC_016837 [Scirpophaga incertulas]